MSYRALYCALIIVISIFTLAPAVAQQGSAQVERLVERFEHDLERAFMRGRNELDQFRNRHAMQAAVALSQHLNGDASDND